MNEFLKLIKKCDSQSALLYGEWLDFMYENEHADGDIKEAHDEIAKHKVECVAQYGGEGKGDKIWAVFSVDGLGLFKVHGWYASYAGCELQGMFEVEEGEEVVKVYKKKESK